MSEFMLLFHHERMNGYQPSPEELQAIIGTWQAWLGGIAAQGALVTTNMLEDSGQTLHADGLITDGPYTEVKEMLGGYTTVTAPDLAAATELAKGCPIFGYGGRVEIRQVSILG